MKIDLSFSRHTFLVAGMLVLLNCSPSTSLTMMKPAEIDVGTIRRIAIMDFQGPSNSGSTAASLFVSHLFPTNFFTIIERTELQRVLEEHALAMSGAIDIETAIQAGNLLGAEGIIVGDVIGYSCDDRKGTRTETRKVWTGDYEKDDDGNVIMEKNLFGKKVKKKKYKEELVDVEIIERQANVTLSFRMIDVATGQIIASKEASESHTKTVDVGGSTLQPKSELLGELTSTCINRFVRQLAPHPVTVTAKFAEGGEAVKQGIEYAKNDLWDKAELTWQSVLREQPENHAAWYNLGLAFEAQGELRKAEQSYDHATSLKAEKLYMEGLKRIRKSIVDQQKLDDQMKRKMEQPKRVQ